MPPQTDYNDPIDNFEGDLIEEEAPREAAPPPSDIPPEIMEAATRALQTLTDAGFSIERSRKALLLNRFSLLHVFSHLKENFNYAFVRDKNGYGSGYKLVTGAYGRSNHRRSNHSRNYSVHVNFDNTRRNCSMRRKQTLHIFYHFRNNATATTLPLRNMVFIFFSIFKKSRHDIYLFFKSVY